VHLQKLEIIFLPGIVAAGATQRIAQRQIKTSDTPYLRNTCGRLKRMGVNRRVLPVTLGWLCSQRIDNGGCVSRAGPFV
jgi:hypothetical protein